MTIEEKARAYDKALEKSKEFYILCKKCGAKDTVDFLEEIFPELVESEDEKIRKQIICGMNALKDRKKKTFATIPIDDCIAWLEKRGKPTWTEKDNETLDNAIWACLQKYGNDSDTAIWLKAIKQRIGGIKYESGI